MPPDERGRRDSDAAAFYAVIAGITVFGAVTGALAIVNEYVIKRHVLAAGPIGFACGTAMMLFLGWRFDRR